MAAVLTRDIIKKFGELPAVNGIMLNVQDGEFMVLLGPSGGVAARPRSCGSFAGSSSRPAATSLLATTTSSMIFPPARAASP